MDARLFTMAAGRALIGFVAMAALMFIPAGTLDYREGWLLLCLLFAPMLVVGAILAVKAPALLAKRLNAREPEPEQRRVVLLSGLMFAACFVLAGLNRRFGWLRMPPGGVAAASALFLLGFALYGEVLRENAYLSRAVEVQPGQRVIDTGLYGVVRHPMYAATLLMFLSMPLVLGSPVSFAVTLCYIPIIAGRIRNEEQVLEAGLAGYREYKSRVRWRLVPGVW